MAGFGPFREGQSFQLELPHDVVGFDADAFDVLIRSQGVLFVHYRAMRCPVGMIDRDDVRRPHEHHVNCSNGFIYTEAGTFTAGFLGNSKQSEYRDAGRYDDSTVQIVLPRYYDNDASRPVRLAQFDRLYLKEIECPVTTWHTFEAHVSGIDRLMFPVLEVEDLMDADGRTYRQNVDFTVSPTGQLVWGDRRPGTDSTGRGKVCSIRYSYRPYWYVERMLHEVRVAQVEDEVSGDRSVVRMPQAAMITRERHFEKEQADDQAPVSARQKPGPADGGFGPR